MNRVWVIALSAFLFCLMECGCTSVIPISSKGDISPVEYGLLEAKTGEERYNILLKTHKLAIEKGMAVDYRGLNRIDITIPQNAASIPLGYVNDFAGVVFNVTNRTKDFFLFSYVNRPISIAVSGTEIDQGNFFTSTQLRTGQKLLSIEDKNPWVANRKNYSYGHQRKDILLIENGRARNKTVMPYYNAQSTPVCKYYDVILPYIQVSSVTLNRTSDSTSKTYLFKITGANDVRVKDVIINTPTSELVSDAAISIQDCTNVRFENVSINGTYSRTNHSGYGITLNNVWNYYATKLNAKGNWGIFGNNNINTALIENSEINRFDIHCYGRDISFENVTFIDLYNQFSSTFGTIQFDNCNFKNFVPVLYESSYNAYSPHNVVFNNCIFHLNSQRNYLINAGRLSLEENVREELKDKSWPNVTIKQMRVIVDGEAPSFNLFKVLIDPKFEGSVHSIDNITIDGLTFEYGNIKKAIPVNLVDKDVKTMKPLKISVNKLIAMPEATLNLNINKGTMRNSISVRRSTVSKVIKE